MSAITTARRILDWAIQANFASAGPPPQGDADALEELMFPDKRLCKQLEQLIVMRIAQMQLSNPPLADSRPAGTESLILATALGLCEFPKIARMLLEVMIPARTAMELVARHALLAPALPFLPEALYDDFKEQSLLTGVLTHPLNVQKAEAIRLTDQFLNSRQERQTLVLYFARPTRDMQVREWRLSIMEIFRLGNPNQQKFVLDVYESQMIHFQKEVLEQITKARHIIMNPTPRPEPKKEKKKKPQKDKVVESDIGKIKQISSKTEEAPAPKKYAFQDDYQIRNAISAGQWWGPLHDLDRTHEEELRARRYLGYEYRKGIDLYNLCKKFKNIVNRAQKT